MFDHEGNACGTSRQPNANARGAFATWTKAGFPAEKLFLGLPLYGWVSRSTRTTLTGAFVNQGTTTPTGATADEDEVIAVQNDHVAPAEHPDAVFLDGAHPRVRDDGDGVVHAEATLNGWLGQQIPFNRLVAAGVLARNGDGYVAAGGFRRGKFLLSSCPPDGLC
jgi:chitinase